MMRMIPDGCDGARFQRPLFSDSNLFPMSLDQQNLNFFKNSKKMF